MNLDHVRQMKTKMSDIERLETEGKWLEADVLWEDMLKIASSEKGMTREAAANIGTWKKLLNVLYPRWRGTIGGTESVKEFEKMNPAMKKFLRQKFAPLNKTWDKTEQSVSSNDLTKELIKLEEKNPLKGMIVDNAEKYVVPGYGQTIPKWLLRNVGIPGAILEGASHLLGNKAQGGSTPDEQFNPNLPGTSGRYYPRNYYPSETSSNGRNYDNTAYMSSPYAQASGGMYEQTYADDFPFEIPEWEPGSVSGVVMDPYGRRVIDTIPS